ncbi:hypothetical protein [Tenacibaculum amylolyticum]|uniref:hypothetical protein n=1 Tax=Tenacibaculum amylolyticum TaxID=104269 RepID=UPI003893322B
MLIKEISLELFADYFQFYIQDESVSGDLTEAWTDIAVERLLALNHGVIGVGTVRNMDVLTTFRIYDEEPDILAESISIHQINECDFIMESENMVVAGCTDYFPDAHRVKIGKGLFRARIYYKDLDKISDDGLEGEDSYEIHLWPISKKLGLKILKNRNI